uniref:NADH dehydrogenase subunit 4L n=1 Tax=Monilinia fructicola TaxID=38448 RepID=A0A889XQ06_MONFR|nr:NADH dehydrogenase subunit 4L [Monilinia fructicola]QRF72240.1 NADH dehydrogenase subunit 4L [Monilinia fructicola]QYB19431.1 NADH dehydrogenase subunit 4L [Monilinia fructicola]QYB19492.1 NADH dehydrogenase subunit 4L [Monilinia fructicola]QYB19554.1 NADH dehydrogenase subunit 4L [Monilinia fructicola]QYB19616.1 NADH dehydrogenase subunit 4L [Monilinia fructicola]
MSLSLILFLIGILGFVLNRKNIILMLISIEIMLLAITFLILISSLSFDDILGQTYAIYIIAIAGAESAIGLGILVAFYRLNSSLFLSCLSRGQTTYSKTINKFSFKRIARCYSTMAKNNYTTNQAKISSIDPWFITGLFDAESSFVVTVLKNPRYKTGWNVQARVQIKMQEKDRVLIQSIQEFFGAIGYVSKLNNSSAVEFRVSTLKDLVDVILPHFDNYPLITKKHSDYLLFKQIVLLMLNKEHNTLEGIQKIVNIRASLNTGLSKDLKEAFPMTIPVTLNLENRIKNNNLHPEWVAGFSTGESNFFIAVQKSKTKSGLSTSLRFSIAQHSRDLLLLESFVNFFGSGFVMNYKKRLVCEFIITKIDHVVEHIIPFFDKHPILGSKHLNFLDFKSAAYIIKNKEHLNEDGLGLEEILQLKRRITLLYSNKAMNNHSVVDGTEKSDQKR